MNISLSPFAPKNLDSRGGFGSSVPRQPAHLHTQAESGAYLRDSSRDIRRESQIRRRFLIEPLASPNILLIYICYTYIYTYYVCHCLLLCSIKTVQRDDGGAGTLDEQTSYFIIA